MSYQACHVARPIMPRTYDHVSCNQSGVKRPERNIHQRWLDPSGCRGFSPGAERPDSYSGPGRRPYWKRSSYFPSRGASGGSVKNVQSFARHIPINECETLCRSYRAYCKQRSNLLRSPACIDQPDLCDRRYQSCVAECVYSKNLSDLRF